MQTHKIHERGAKSMKSLGVYYIIFKATTKKHRCSQKVKKKKERERERRKENILQNTQFKSRQ